MRKPQPPKENADNLSNYSRKKVNFGTLNLFYLKISRFL